MSKDYRDDQPAQPTPRPFDNVPTAQALATATTTTTTTGPNTTLRVESILLKAFDNAQESARQSYESREKLMNLYLVLMGTLATGLGAAYQIGGLHTLFTPMAAIALFAASVFCATLFGTYVTRRLTYIESLIAANTVVEYYVRHLRTAMPSIEEAFRWRLANIPCLEPFRVFRFLVSYPMALSGSLCLAGAVFITDNLFVTPGAGANSTALTGPLSWLIPTLTALAAFSLTLIAQATFYVRQARGQRKDVAKLVAFWASKPDVQA